MVYPVHPIRHPILKDMAPDLAYSATGLCSYCSFRTVKLDLVKSPLEPYSVSYY